jgi:hypothetical protein
MTIVRKVLFAVSFAVLHATCTGGGFETPRSEVVPNSYIVKFRESTGTFISPIEPAVKRAITPRFGEHSSGQSKDQLAWVLGINGRVKAIFDKLNAAHLEISDAEAERLRGDPRVLRVEPNWTIAAAQTTQTNPGWALDRLDQTSLVLNNSYTYTWNGAGQTIYILDTGLNLSNSTVAAEFGGRASVIWDVNEPAANYGYDCHYPGHGTMVASAAAGSTYGTAKGATVVVAKITYGCSGSSDSAIYITAFNWLATNAAKGSIANLSYSYYTLSNCVTPQIVQTVDDAVKAAHDAGIIVVIAAGNDGCDVSNYSLSRSPYAFVVGMTMSNYLPNWDAKSDYSRYGANVSVYAPGYGVTLLGKTGSPTYDSGTSYAAPYIAGMFASGCHYMGTFCSTMSNATVAYNALRSAGSNVVWAENAGYLPGGIVGLFISRVGW